MFLYMLNDNEGKAFMELAVLAMKVNGQEKQCEKMCIKGLKGDAISIGALERFVADYAINLTELGLADSSYKVKGLSFEDAVSAFKHSSVPVKRCVILEICGILYADKEIDSDELKWVNNLANSFKIDKSETERLIRWSKDFSDFLEVGLMYINAKS